ncbi:hypothetical protein CC78DRAFT_527957 [Lojkania enalia]|uniref:Phosphoribosylaminoimidazole-succinocarboxamide synthase n=1 Tax=Lojkania enalia TaxID=147567 RepID=A0A9P4ND23_9PLEO|nr:hypothetical protein CC78DRAFT_527957 [Didymosphaeria enalia]
MSVESPFQLKHTNVSRPQLSHSESQQSITASEGYYSLSENTSSESDERSSKPYHTPASQSRTPNQSHEHLQQHPDAPVTSLKGVGIPRQHSPADRTDNDRNHALLHSPTVSTIVEERPETQEGGRSYKQVDMDSQSLATTPGEDDTPYIRFAIDQLTRDEEVRGSRMYPSAAPPEDEDYPVERVVSDEGLGYFKHQQVEERPPQEAPSGFASGRGSVVQKDIFVPFRPSPDSLPHVPLHFLPSILRPVWFSIYLLLCLVMLGGLIFCAVYSDRNNGEGLWNYTSFGDSRYFVFEYLPTILGMIILMWLFQVQIALQRIVPFVSMASESTQQRSEAIFLQLYPTQFLLPKLEHFRAGHPLIGACYLIFWLFLWSIPLLASSFNVRWWDEGRAWRWVVVQGVIWTVIVLYILLVVALLAIFVFLLRKQTGLKWDPRSLADIITLLERSNIVRDYNGSETFKKVDFRNQLGSRTDRIGYWSTTRRPNDVFYGIGEEGGSTRQYSIEQGRIMEKGPEAGTGYNTPLQSTQRPGDFSIRMDIRSPRLRLRYLPWYLRDTSVIAWIVTAIVLLIAFLVISFIDSAVRLGFLPQVFARANSAGFSASNFLYSFVPALIGHFLFLIFLTFDYSLRGLRPYISLSSKGGATAESSLLIDYSSRLPISVTLSALENRHFSTVVLSFVSLCSTTLPILAGGCFWTQYYPNGDVVRVSAELSGYYALCFFLALYTISLFALLPSRRRGALPHRSSSLAEIISWVYQSQILADRAFARPQTKGQLIARLMGPAYVERTFGQSLTSLIRPSRDNLRGDSPTDPALTKTKSRQKAEREAGKKRQSVLEPGKIRYGFGIYVGRDGLEHLGIDRVKRGGERSGRELVIWEEQRSTSAA